jgi:hypothetical protein
MISPTVRARWLIVLSVGVVVGDGAVGKVGAFTTITYPQTSLEVHSRHACLYRIRLMPSQFVFFFLP